MRISRLADESDGKGAFEESTTLGTGRTGSFEIIVNSKYLAYSKLSTGKFPDAGELASDIAAFATTGETPDGWAETAST